MCMVNVRFLERLLHLGQCCSQELGELLREAAKIAFSNLEQPLRSYCTVSLGQWRLLHPAQLSPIYLEQSLESRPN